MSSAATPDLVDFRSDTYSQFGEDGIVAEVLRRVATVTTLDRWCVDVGAWDGVHLSNTARLIRADGYSAVLVEADPRRAAALPAAHPGARVVALCARVGFTGDRRLDALLAGTGVPHDFDVLSIDIDGNDYHVFAALERHRPKVVLVEFNPTIPNAVDWVQPADERVAQGASLAALVRLGRSKGYAPVAATRVNLVLVRDDLLHAVLGAAEPTLDELRPDADIACVAFVGYDGTVMLTRPLQLPWLADFPVAPSRLQFLPRPLRRYGGADGVRGRAARAATRAWANPRLAATVLARRLGVRASRSTVAADHG